MWPVQGRYGFCSRSHWQPWFLFSHCFYSLYQSLSIHILFVHQNYVQDMLGCIASFWYRFGVSENLPVPQFPWRCSGFPDGTSVKEPACQCRRLKRLGFDPWVRKNLWSRKWQPTPVFLPGESHGQRSLVGIDHSVTQSWTLQKWLSTHTHIHWCSWPCSHTLRATVLKYGSCPCGWGWLASTMPIFQPWEKRQRRKDKKQNTPTSLKNRSWKLHMPLLFTFSGKKFVTQLSARDTGKCIF